MSWISYLTLQIVIYFFIDGILWAILVDSLDNAGDSPHYQVVRIHSCFYRGNVGKVILPQFLQIFIQQHGLQHLVVVWNITHWPKILKDDSNQVYCPAHWWMHRHSRWARQNCAPSSVRHPTGSVPCWKSRNAHRPLARQPGRVWWRCACQDVGAGFSHAFGWIGVGCPYWRRIRPSRFLAHLHLRPGTSWKPAPPVLLWRTVPISAFGLVCRT